MINTLMRVQAEGVTDDNPYDIRIFQLWNGRIFRMLY